MCKSSRKSSHLPPLPGFRRYMRMELEQFNELTNLVAADVVKMDTQMRRAVSPPEWLAVTLRYLATGESFRSLEYQFRINRKTIYSIVIEVCDAIYKRLSNENLAFPSSSDQWSEIEDGTFRIASEQLTGNTSISRDVTSMCGLG